MRGGYHDEAMAWRDWLLRAVAGDVSQAADHVRAGGRAAARRVGGRLAARLRGLRAGADRQRRVGPVPARRLRRGHVGASTRPHDRGRAQPRPAWDLQMQLIEFLEKGWREPDDGIWEVRGPAPALHPLQGHGLGGGRPGRAHARGVARARGAARAVASAARRDPRRGLREGLQRRRSGRSPSTTAPTSSTPACS